MPSEFALGHLHSSLDTDVHLLKVKIHCC